MSSDGPPGYLAEPTGFLLHMIDGDDCVTHTVQVSHAGALLGLHHPPMPVGIPFLDGMRLLDGYALGEVIRSHSNVVRVMAGHVHRVITAAFAGSVLTVAPSTYRQSHLLMSSDGPPGVLTEPTGFLLHVLDGKTCVTHTVPVSHAAAVMAWY